MHADFKSAYQHQGSKYFRRFLKDCKKISSHIKVKRIKHGFFRIYFKNKYIGECYKEMPLRGYDIEEIDNRFEDKKFWEQREDRAELTRKIKNYVEGYVESLDMIRTSMYLMRTSKEHNKEAELAYASRVVK